MSDEAKQGWDAFCETHGVTYSAMVEASGLLLRENSGGVVEDNESVIDLARRIDFERAKRR